MKKKPIIGICPLWDEEKNSYWMLPGYMDAVLASGGVPIMLPFAEEDACIEELAEMCDGFVFTGGQDVSPEIYGETVKFDNVGCCKKRDALELALLEKALQQDKSILGVCRGVQFINAALGGTLYQDLPREISSPLEHHQTPPYDVPIHTVELTPGTPLYTLSGKEEIAVNSYHHQAIKTLSPKLACMATASDGIMEAVYMLGKKFVFAVQWHPEFLYAVDETSRKIFRAFIESME